MGFNMFAYCMNNPVNCADYAGQFVISLISYGFACAITLVVIDALLDPQVQNSINQATDDFYKSVTSSFQPEITVNRSVSQIKTQAKTKSEEKPITEVENPAKKNEEYNYWAADLVFGKVVVSTPLTAAVASERVAMGENIMCRNKSAAIYILLRNHYVNSVGPEKEDKDGYYWHYYPTRNHTGYNSIHIWFYT